MFPLQLRNSFYVYAWLVHYCHPLAWHVYYRTSLVCAHRDRFRYLPSSAQVRRLFCVFDSCPPSSLQPPPSSARHGTRSCSTLLVLSGGNSCPLWLGEHPHWSLTTPVSWHPVLAPNTHTLQFMYIFEGFGDYFLLESSCQQVFCCSYVEVLYFGCG